MLPHAGLHFAKLPLELPDRLRDSLLGHASLHLAELPPKLRDGLHTHRPLELNISKRGGRFARPRRLVRHGPHLPDGGLEACDGLVVAAPHLLELGVQPFLPRHAGPHLDELSLELRDCFHVAASARLRRLGPLGPHLPDSGRDLGDGFAVAALHNIDLGVQPLLLRHAGPHLVELPPEHRNRLFRARRPPEVHVVARGRLARLVLHLADGGLDAGDGFDVAAPHLLQLGLLRRSGLHLAELPLERRDRPFCPFEVLAARGCLRRLPRLALQLPDGGLQVGDGLAVAAPHPLQLGLQPFPADGFLDQVAQRLQALGNALLRLVRDRLLQLEPTRELLALRGLPS
mmetsp:Transcript_60853/g.175299  ORF Transcript_60853/g.175299 Transcript_60853/m.175299 type:complete len:344 (-) Transcript_60853:692-1723(-)